MDTIDDRLALLLEHSPVVTPSDALQFGIDSKSLSRLTRSQKLVRLRHGLYAGPDYEPGAFSTIFEVQKSVPKGIACLLTSLSVHEIGTQNPYLIWLAIPRGTRKPQAGNLPVRTVIYSVETYNEGIETITREGLKIRTYGVAKTIADCFKFRNRIGLDVAIEALKDALYSRKTTPDQVLKASRICQVESVITPYMESVL